MNQRLELQMLKFIEHLKVKGYSERTTGDYHCQLRLFLEYLIHETDVEQTGDIDAACLHGFASYLYTTTTAGGKRLSLATQRSKLTVVRSFFRFLYEQQIIFSDPSAHLPLPKIPKNLPRGVMSEAQVEVLLEQPDLTTPLGFRNRTILELLYASGMRNSELRHLAIYDLDLIAMSVNIRQGKHAKERSLPLGEIAADFLKEYLQTIRPQLNPAKDETTMFISKNARPITSANLITMMNKYITQADLAGHFTPHSLRHSCATHMLKRGANIRYIQQLLGHASVATTQIYTKVAPQDLKAVHRQFHPRECSLQEEF